jgi:hypothetical protein
MQKLVEQVVSANAPDDRLEHAVAEQLALNFSDEPAAVQPESRRPSGADRARQEAGEAVYHQGRVLLLIDAMAGKNGVLDGLTKLAKLDFLLRYPVFLKQLADSGKIRNLVLDDSTAPTEDEERAVESRMIRYKYGPWDDRYYGIIGALIGRGLIEYAPGRGRVALRTTQGGHAIAMVLAADPAWKRTASRCVLLRAAFARMSGNALKELIYRGLPDVVDRPHRMEV